MAKWRVQMLQRPDEPDLYKIIEADFVEVVDGDLNLFARVGRSTQLVAIVRDWAAVERLEDVREPVGPEREQIP